MTDDIGGRMREDWNRRAQENARWFIASDVQDDDEFRASGAIDVDRALTGLERPWLKSATVLEIGCGTGRMTEFLAPLVRQLFAVDVSTEMIERTRARLGVVGNLELLPVGGDNLAELMDQSFDLVLSYIVLQHIPNFVVRKYFREIRRILRQDGIFRGQVASIRERTFSQPPDTDTFSMRSWGLDELRFEFADWSRLTFDVRRVTDSTDHIWITASP